MTGLSKHINRKGFYYAMLTPLVVIMLALYAYPAVYSLFMSLMKFNYVLDLRPTWIGFRNFTSFFRSQDGLQVTKNTLLFTFGAVTVETCLGLAVALAFNRKFRFRGIARALVLVPFMIAPVVVGYEWRWLYNDPYGLINFVLRWLHIIPQSISFTTSARFAMPSLLVADIWYATPFIAVLCMGGLQSLPEEPYESAIIDGASAFQRFIYITLPLLRPVLMAAILIRTMDAFQTFDLVFIVTYGGPGNLTELLNTYAYKEAFHNFHMGYASAVSTVSLLIMVFMSLVLLRITRKNA